MGSPGSVEVVPPTYALVRERKREGFVLGHDTIEPVLEDRLDVTVRASADAERTATRSLEPLVSVALAESQDAEARAEALLGMRPVREDCVAELACSVTDLARPGEDARRRPLRVRAMRTRHVLDNGREASSHHRSSVRRDAHPTVQDLDHVDADACLDFLVHQPKRH